MSTKTYLHGIVSLDNVRQNNIVYTDLGEKLEESIFEQQYKNAARIIAAILRESKAALDERKGYCRHCRRSNCESCRHRDDRLYRNEPSTKRTLTSFHTAVPFIGDRGTGKTSVMYSVWERLRNYNGTNPEATFYLGTEFDDAKFVTLDMIDAGMLKTSEDVMEIILAQMLGYLEELRADNDFRELYRRIDELHRDLCLVHLDETRKREGHGLTSLQKVADSRNAITKFQQLVKEFLQNMSIHKFNCQPCYLVVALDDVDMYQGSNWGMNNIQFALLEHIYCHLRIPGLIVLMTFNEHLLKRACNRHFEDVYFGRPLIERDYTPTEQQDIEGLTAQFMSKLFPQEKRIYMPNFMLVDALDRPNLYVRPVLNRTLIAPFGEGEQALPVKEFMLRLIAHKTDVFFDAAGTKKHFFEPRNLRELGALFQFVVSMEDVEDTERQNVIKARNRQRLMDYLKNQYALRHLDAEEYEEFSNLLTLPLWRQDRTLIDKIRLHRLTVANEVGDFGRVEDAKEDRWRYSYGELLHNIYFSTRISKIRGGSESLFRKEFMHCIFGTHSVQMNEAVRSTNPRKDMLKVVGSSLAGRWANKMLPKLWVYGFDRKVGMGSISLPVRDFFDWEIPESVQTAIMNLCKGDDKGAEKELFQFMDALVVAGMFFTKVPAGGLGIRLDVDKDEADNAVLCLRSNSEEHICFNVFNFAINLYDALPGDQTQRGGYIPLIQQKLEKLGMDFVKQLQSDWEREYAQAQNAWESIQNRVAKRGLEYVHPKALQREQEQLRKEKNKMEYASLWMELQGGRVSAFDAAVFIENWNCVLQKIIAKYTRAICKWRQEYGEYKWVLPVQNFDMMYNINKRLANVSYYDIPDDANASEAFTCYVKLYNSVVEELQNQDDVYFKNKPGEFAKAFRDCVFYSAIMASERTDSGQLNERYNAYIEEILVSIVSSTVHSNETRKYMSEI